jgi:uncharacterized membrane protein YccF (DUF307 family)
MGVVMKILIQILITLPLLMLCFQLYSYSVNCEGKERQHNCQMFGIVFMTAGIVSLVFKSIVFSFFGLILMMFGFRLMARGLDRLEKKYSDQHKDGE